MGLSFGTGIVAEKVVDFGNPENKPSMPPPVGFVWKYMAGSCALYPGCGLGLQVDDARPKDMDEEVGEENQSMVKDSQDEDLDSDDLVT